ncbi:MAG: phosphoglycerate kinase [Acidobacteria bacterium RIFCSPLOWO2_12_FULL_67_14b]|nr:MAG: phosphoglycerate kinase [Acidobacteria bacterium RIFCSPLOWO2_12_FULL_67_14b]
MAKYSIRDLALDGKRVFIRVDFNVPIKNGVIGDETRITSSLPTIRHALAHGATVILASHLGRPKGKPAPEFSLKPVATRLGQLLGRPVGFARDSVGAPAEQAIAAVAARAGSKIVLLENLRFHAGEEKDDPAFAKALAALAGLYVNDAFGAAHRAHASVHGIVKHFKSAAAGLLMEKELTYLGLALGHPDRPFVAVIGGAKVSDKIEVIESMLGRVDRLLVGGAMAYTFFKALGMPVGRSLVEDDKLDEARSVMSHAQARGVTLQLPVDHVVADRIDASAATAVLKVGDAAIGERMGLDIGPETARLYAGLLSDAKTVVWNGPMGVFELAPFANGTMAVARAMAAVKGTTIIGGGDSVAAINAAGVANKMTHISTGGGASLEFLGGAELPGVAALPDRP